MKILFDNKNIYHWILVLFLISFFISIVISLFNVDFKSFIIILIKSMIIIYMIFCIIVYLIYQIKGVDKWDGFLDKIIIFYSIFFVLFIILWKYSLLK